MKKMILSLMLCGGMVMAAGDYERSSNVVTDNSTGLEWYDGAAPAEANWEEAIAYCENLATGTLGLGTDWRLPNANELYSIVDRSRSTPSIDPIFENTAAHFYWTSTSVADATDHAYSVSFSSGRDEIKSKSDAYYVRCVRD